MSISESVGKIIPLKSNAGSYAWELKNFNTIDHATGSFVTSPMIPTYHPTIQWRLILYPNGRIKANEGYLDISFQVFSNVEITMKILAFTRVFLKNLSNRQIEKETSDWYNFKVQEKKSYGHFPLADTCSCDRFILRQEIMDQKNHLLRDNCLKIYFEYLSYDSIFFSPSQIDVINYMSRLNQFDDFKKLLAGDKFSDFTIVVGDKQIRVHKAILASRSPVFEAMFSNEMQENKQNKVEIVDIQYPVLKGLFQYIYTGIVDNFGSMASELLIAADKYCVKGLKVLCEKTLSENLNVGNALNLLTLADTYDAVSLKAQVIQFIVNNPKIVDKEEFSTLLPSLMCEVTRSVTCKIEQ